MIDQAQQRSADAKDPVHDPHAEDVLLLFVENALQSRQDRCAEHKQKAQMDMQRGKDQGGKQDEKEKTGSVPEMRRKVKWNV